jgi:hypothetical protein
MSTDFLDDIVHNLTNVIPIMTPFKKTERKKTVNNLKTSRWVSFTEVAGHCKERGKVWVTPDI